MRAAYENLLVLRHLDGVLRGSPWTMAPLARSVLVSACRVLFVLLPRDLAQQEENAGRVAKANAFGYRKLVNSMEGTRRLIALVPAADVAEAIRSAPDKIPEKDIKDGPMLEETVNSVVTLLRTAPDSPVTAESAEDLEILGEQIRFMFNTYSGMAHGLAWPLFVPSSARTEPGEEGMPGDWATDFFQLAGLVHLAANALMRASHKAS